MLLHSTRKTLVGPPTKPQITQAKRPKPQPDRQRTLMPLLELRILRQSPPTKLVGSRRPHGWRMLNA
jgi:hypothetical protein